MKDCSKPGDCHRLHYDFTTDPQPEHAGSSFAFTTLPDSDKLLCTISVKTLLPTTCTQQTRVYGEQGLLPHQASYGACICTPTTPYPTAQ